MVVDSADLFGGGQTNVEQAAQELANTTGATVYVRTVNDAGASLDQWTADLLAACPTWQAPNANPGPVSFENTAKENLLLFALSVNPRGVGIFYGGDWKPVLKGDGQAQRIQSNTMAPNFPENFAGGFVDGIEETSRVIYDYQHPSASDSGSGGGGEPIDLSGLWTIIKWLLLAIAVGVVGYFAVTGWLQYDGHRRARNLARDNAKTQRNAATSLLFELQNGQRPSVRDAELAELSSFGDDTAKQARTLFDEVKKYLDRAASAYTKASSSDGDPDLSDLDAEIYDATARRYAAVVESAEKAKQADDKLHALYQDVDRALSQAGANAQIQLTTMDQLETTLSTLRASGVITAGIDSMVTTAKETLNKVAGAGRDASALKLLDQGREQAAAAVTAHDDLVANRAAALKGVTDLKASLDGFPALLHAAHDTYQRLQSNFNPKSSEAVTGNGSEAERCAHKATNLLAEATHAAAPDTQDWEEALKHLQKGASQMEEAESLLHSISELEVHLESAKTELPGVISRCRVAVAEAEEYIHAHDDDIDDDWWPKLDRAKAKLEEAEEALNQQQPRYLTTLKLALAAETAIGQIYANSVDEHTAAVQLRQQAKSSLKSAKAEISRAKEYIQDHRSDVESGAKSMLRSAQDRLQSAMSATDPSTVVRYAQQAIDEANAAYTKAKRNFDDAEDERRRARRRREEAEERRRQSSIVVGGGSYGGYSSSGGGSSSSWGGFSGGGGSSSGFGGFSGGGGSSSGW